MLGAGHGLDEMFLYFMILLGKASVFNEIFRVALNSGFS